MPDWFIGLLNAVGFSWLLGMVKRTLAWLKPSGLAGGKPLLFTIGETAYIASHPYVPEREVKDIIVQVKLGNPNLERSKTVMTFKLNVSGKRPYPVSEARALERNGGWYLVPPGGGFSTVPRKDYMRLPMTIPAGGAAVSWIGFCLLERSDLTLAEAWRVDATVIVIQADGTELSCRLPVCELPSAA